ncbi:NAD(P)/FAD-dependent oxidoreductase [Candidatus Saccharibacteria bacterium]|nr:NAD(P)/FAD-dependent oxidoreductase [Candidatus Saccharibacteria bacterium]
MGKRFDYEYIVIGGGIAGITAAKQLAEAGRKVAIVEKNLLGGNSTVFHDVPSSMVFNITQLYARAIAGNRFGLSTSSLKYDYNILQAWRQKSIIKANTTAKHDLDTLGVAVIQGRARFIGNYDLAIDGNEKIKTVSASKFIVATGTVLETNGISGIDVVPFLTPNSALSVVRPPKAALIVGGGTTGCEIAQYYSSLGAKVVIVELSDRILPSEDEDISKVIYQHLTKRCNVKIFTGTRVTSLQKDNSLTRVSFMRGGEEKTVRVETVVLATGYKPNTDLDLPNAGVSFDKKGIVVDRTLQTSNRNVYAIGGVIDTHSSTERAIYTGEVAVMNMLDRTKTFVNYDGFMRCMDTDPQLAIVGLTEDDLLKRHRKYRKVIIPLSSITASIVHDETAGFIKILADSQGKILGAAMIGPNASEVLQEIALAIRHNLPLIEVASTPHKENDWNNLVRVAAKKLLLTNK